MNEDTLRPFFIIGHPRSGTTLLRFMLSSHPRLHVPDETGFLPFLATDPETPMDRDELAELLRRIGQLNRFWGGIVVSPDAFYDALTQPTLPAVLDALYRLQSPVQTARWGDKTPLYIQYIPQIRAIFPRAQFIHVIRDGRDAALSARAKWGHEKRYMDLSYLLRNWVRNVQTGQAAGAQLGRQKYSEVRYEELVTDPDNVLRTICTFLDEPYEASMLNFQAAAIREGGGFDAHLEAQETLHSGSIGRWQTQLSPFERQLSDAVAGTLLADLGYALDDDLTPPGAASQLRLGWLAAKFKVLDSLRTLLYRYGRRTLNFNRRQQ